MAPVSEPGLEALLQKGRKRISATRDFETAVAGTEMTFLVVPTPGEPHGGFSARYVLEAAGKIGKALRRKSGFHLVVLTSTVLPGATEGELRPALEAHSGKRCGVDFGLCYSPEFIALGSVIRDMLNPDFYLIGESDARSGEMLASFYRTVCDNKAPVTRMNIVNAELTKIAINTYITMKISYANNLAEICERIPGASVDVVTSAVGIDTRIGRKYLKGALGYGGPCFPRDNAAFAFLARRLGAEPTLAEATDEVNTRQVGRLVDFVTARLSRGDRVAILGLSYKPDTGVVEESQAVMLARALAERKVPTVVYDPEAMENARRELGDAVAYASSMEQCVRQAAVIVLATPWEEFQWIEPSHLMRGGKRPPVLLDCWNLLDGRKFEGAAEYVRLGAGPRLDE
jgi:UDPglucose 6-dehydrogenase